jgi:cation-transporting ATPase 13A1
LVIGGAHTLAIAEEIIIGDPLEKQAFEGIKFKQAVDGTRVSSGPGVQITQKKYMFNSSLKRMSVLAQINDNHHGTTFRILSKGAPEVLKKFMKTLPNDYDETY